MSYNYQQSAKDEERVGAMFDAIAHRYDFLNHVLSLGIDKYWRKTTVNTIIKNNPFKILDIATGTADLAIATASKSQICTITALDISKEMLYIAERKIKDKGLHKRIQLIQASALALPFENNTFDAISIAFGIRNFKDIDMGLTEIYRVLKLKGQLYVLEFSKPKNKIIKALYHIYFSKILPFIGNLISGHKYAYSYLNKSAVEFPDGVTFIEILSKNRFEHITQKRMSFGIATLYVARK